MDVDRTDEDRTFFAAERDELQQRYDALVSAHDKSRHHARMVMRRTQARVVLGDAVLDRGVSRGKARMKLELKDEADHVFGKNVSDLTEAPRDEEPKLVLTAVGKFAQVGDFPGKAEMATDLTNRAQQQQANFTARATAEVDQATLDGAVALAIKAGADGLYGLEKRLLDRFPRETKYVRAFFYDVSSPRKPKAAPAAPTGPAGTGGGTP